MGRTTVITLVAPVGLTGSILPSSPGVCSKLARLTKLKTHHIK